MAEQPEPKDAMTYLDEVVRRFKCDLTDTAAWVSADRGGEEITKQDVRDALAIICDSNTQHLLPEGDTP